MSQTLAGSLKPRTLSFFNRAKEGGKRHAVHFPQLPMRPLAITWDKGETWKELNLATVLPGGALRVEVPEDVHECVVRVELLNDVDSDPRRRRRIMPIQITDFKREFEPCSEACQTIAPESTYVISMCPDFIGRIVKMKVHCRPLCLTCGGRGMLGTETIIECPRCKGDSTFLEPEFKDVLVNDLRIGRNCQLPTANAVAVRYLEGEDLVMDSFCPGVFVLISISNPLKVPVLIGGEFTCEEIVVGERVVS